MENIVLVVKRLFYISVITMVVSEIMPSEKNRKIIKMICGLIMIAIVSEPIFNMTDLGSTFQTFYKSIIHNNQLNDLKYNSEYDNSYSKSMIEQCKSQIQENVETIIIQNGLFPVDTEIDIEDDSSNKNYGCIISIKSVVSDNDNNYNAGNLKNISIEQIEINKKGKAGRIVQDDKTEKIIQDISDYYELDKGRVSVWYKG